MTLPIKTLFVSRECAIPAHPSLCRPRSGEVVQRETVFIDPGQTASVPLAMPFEYSLFCGIDVLEKPSKHLSLSGMIFAGRLNVLLPGGPRGPDPAVDEIPLWWLWPHGPDFDQPMLVAPSMLINVWIVNHGTEPTQVDLYFRAQELKPEGALEHYVRLQTS